MALGGFKRKWRKFNIPLSKKSVTSSLRVKDQGGVGKNCAFCESKLTVFYRSSFCSRECFLQFRKQRKILCNNKWADELKDVEAEIVVGTTFPKSHVDEVVQLLKAGLTCEEVALDMSMSASTVSRIREMVLGLKGANSHLETRPPYERKDIPYEKETELPMLLSGWWTKSFDEPMGETERSLHEGIESSFLTPVQELIDREYEDEQIDFKRCLKSWIDDLTPKAKRVAQDILDNEPVTNEEREMVKAEALLIFDKNYEKENHSSISFFGDYGWIQT